MRLSGMLGGCCLQTSRLGNWKTPETGGFAACDCPSPRRIVLSGIGDRTGETLTNRRVIRIVRQMQGRMIHLGKQFLSGKAGRVELVVSDRSPRRSDHESSAKFLRIRRPSAWLFSGWNWVAKRFSRQIIEQNGSW